MMLQTIRPRWAIALAVFACLFGLLTVKSGGEVLFVDGPERAAAGDYVPFVLWFNFLAGFAYIAGAVGLIKWRSWVVPLAFSIAALSVVVFMALGIHIAMDGAYEIRTVGAMTLRCLVCSAIAYSVHGKFT